MAGAVPAGPMRAPVPTPVAAVPGVVVVASGPVLPPIGIEAGGTMAAGPVPAFDGGTADAGGGATGVAATGGRAATGPGTGTGTSGLMPSAASCCWSCCSVSVN